LDLAEGRRSWLLDHIDEILIAVRRPGYREQDRDLAASASTARTRYDRDDGCAWF
jgi:hypothetical protein